MFFNRKKKKSIKGIKITQLSAQAQIRKIIYDSGCKNPEQIAKLLGLQAVSEDVAEMEMDASFNRIDRISPIIPIIETGAIVSAQISAMAFVQSEIEDGEEAPAEEIVVALTQLFKMVSVSSAISCLSTLLDLGIIVEGYTND